MNKKCPTCSSVDGVREFIYGLPSEEPDGSKFVLGGCCLSDDMPDYRCINCATDFYKDSDKFHNRFISDGSGISFQCKKCKEWVEVSDGIDSHECDQSASPWAGY
jgi:hypothetical protein